MIVYDEAMKTNNIPTYFIIYYLEEINLRTIKTLARGLIAKATQSERQSSSSWHKLYATSVERHKRSPIHCR